MQPCTASGVYLASDTTILHDNYRDYCRSKDTKEEIFIMTLGHDETLEDYEERFKLSYKRTRCTFDPESLKLVLRRGIREDLLETLNMFSRGDIYQLYYDDIKKIFKNSSMGTRKKGMASQYFASSCSFNISIKSEIWNIL